MKLPANSALGRFISAMGMNPDVVLTMIQDGSVEPDILANLTQFVERGAAEKAWTDPSMLSMLGGSGRTRMADRSTGKSVKRAGGAKAGASKADDAFDVADDMDDPIGKMLAAQEEAKKQLEFVQKKARTSANTPVKEMTVTEKRQELKSLGISTEGSERVLEEKLKKAKEAPPAAPKAKASSKKAAPPKLSAITVPVAPTAAPAPVAATEAVAQDMMGDAVQRMRERATVRSTKAQQLKAKRAAAKAAKVAPSTAPAAPSPVAAAASTASAAASVGSAAASAAGGGAGVPPVAPVAQAAAGGAGKGASKLGGLLSKGKGLIGKAGPVLGAVGNVASAVYLLSTLLDLGKEDATARLTAGIQGGEGFELDSIAASEQNLARGLGEYEKGQRASARGMELMASDEEALLQQIAGYRMNNAMKMAQQSRPGIEEIAALMRSME